VKSKTACSISRKTNNEGVEESKLEIKQTRLLGTTSANIKGRHSVTHGGTYILTQRPVCGFGVLSCVALLCGVFVRLHRALFPAGGPCLPPLSATVFLKSVSRAGVVWVWLVFVCVWPRLFAFRRPGSSACTSSLSVTNIFTGSEGTKGPPDEYKLGATSRTRHKARLRNPKQSRSKTQNPHAGLKTGLNHLGRGPGKTTHLGVRPEARVVMKAPDRNRGGRPPGQQNGANLL
jgi:hypothetical protein